MEIKTNFYWISDEKNFKSKVAFVLEPEKDEPTNAMLCKWC